MTGVTSDLRFYIRSCISHCGPECANAFSFSVPAPSLDTCLVFEPFLKHRHKAFWQIELAACLACVILRFRPSICAAPAQVPAPTCRPAGLSSLRVGWPVTSNTVALALLDSFPEGARGIVATNSWQS